MEEYFCPIEEMYAEQELEACKAFVAECQEAPVNRAQLKRAKAALRDAERELRDLQERG